jgi:protein-tyrosine phosphatase
MAGGLLRMIARSKGMVVAVRTAGLAHHNGKRVAEHAITAMAELGIDISGEYSKPMTAQDLAWADIVLPVQRDHGYHLIEDFPNAAAKVHFLDSDVPDPYLGALTDYREKRDLLSVLLSRLVESLQA